METVTLMALAGLVIGFGFGFVIERTNFCTMGAISDAATFGDFRRFRAWMLAMAVAIIGAQALHGAEMIDLGESIYLTANFGWLGAILGGLLFGSRHDHRRRLRHPQPGALRRRRPALAGRPLGARHLRLHDAAWA